MSYLKCQIKYLYLFILTIVAMMFCSDNVNSEPDNGSKEIVIVPDKPTFLYYISKWSSSDRFPVFIGRDSYVDKFALAYNGGKVKFKIADKVDIGKITQQTIYKTVLASFTGDDLNTYVGKGTKEELKKYFLDNNFITKGIVLTNLNSNELFAGVALCAFHKQLIEFYNPPSRPILGSYTQGVKESIRKGLLGILDKWGFPYKGLGNGIDYITLALDIPYKYGDKYSLDDAINREEPSSLNCYAYTGRLMDLDKGLAVYQAMCSMFLLTKNAVFFDLWPKEWMRCLNIGAWDLRKKIPCVYLDNGIDKWRNAIGKKNEFGLVFINAAGNPDQWSGGTLDDIPDSVPTAVNFCHSTSAANPANPDTIAGRWLINGAFAYYGSVSEPYSPAFNLSQDIVSKLIDGEPFSLACQQKDKIYNQFAVPWKLIYIGDPLFRLRFGLRNKDKQFFELMSSCVSNVEDLMFSKAVDKLEEYLNKTKSKDDTTLYYEQAKRFLKKTYELSVVDGIYGQQIYKVYNKQFIQAWYTEYLSVYGIYWQVYSNEFKMIKLYEDTYRSKRDSFKPDSYIIELWGDMIYRLKERSTYIPKWKVLGPLDLTGGESMDDAVSEILRSDGLSPVKYGTLSLSWRDTLKDPFKNYLEIVSNQDNNKKVWFIRADFTVSGDIEPYLIYASNCDSKIYLDNQINESYNKADKSKQILKYPVKLRNGNHNILVALYPDGKKSISVTFRFYDDKAQPVDKIIFK